MLRLMALGLINTLTAGQANAHVRIDSNHAMEWLAPSFTASCVVASCETFSTTDFDPIFNSSVGGGIFTIKEGNAVSADMTLNIWDGEPGGTWSSRTGRLVDSVTISRANSATAPAPSPIALMAGGLVLLAAGFRKNRLGGLRRHNQTRQDLPRDADGAALTRY